MQVNKGKLYTDKQYIELLKIRIKELEEYLDAEKSTSSYLAQRILKAIEFINDNVAVCAFGNEELPHWEFEDYEIQDLLKILKGEENE